MNVLTERQKREQEYYNEFATFFDLTKPVDLAPVHGPLFGKERRPWNSYWRVYQEAVEKFNTGKVILDFGCGPGENSLRMAEIGYLVRGFDISELNINLAQQLFAKHGKTGEFRISMAESLPYSNETFDLIFGIDILHHVDIKKALLECKRVLKPGGTAIFREPLESPFIDWIRNTSLLKKIFPKGPSFELHITADERKLNQTDLKLMQEIFPEVKHHKSILFSRLDKLYRKGENPKASLLEKLDYFLMKLFPRLKYFCGASVIILKR